MCKTLVHTGSSLHVFPPTDAKDLEQLNRNKITHIISIHESPQPLLQVGT